MKNITICITGSIAIYKVFELISKLKSNFNINIIMSKSAQKFINPLLFEALTKNKVIIDIFEQTNDYNIKHISIAKLTDILLICPATANIISKSTYGIADDMITTTILSVKCPVIIAPAMNTNMYNNDIIQTNINVLKKRGYVFINPIKGKLACGDIGDGKLADIETILSYIQFSISKKDLIKKRILISAGPTRENYDSVRFITNASSGKMGYAIANEAMLRGADVTLVTGPTYLNDISMIKTIKTYSADDMYDFFIKNYSNYDFIIKTAAVSDYKFTNKFNYKVKKDCENIKLKLNLNKDILFEIGKLKNNSQILCGFCMETDNILNKAYNKLKTKNCDLIVANTINDKNIVFNSDINTVYIINKYNKKIIYLKETTKTKIANIILDKILNLNEIKKH